jgi:hypothetical protein
MGWRGWVLLLVAMTLATAALGAAPAAWTHVTVLRADGGRLADVTLAWALGGYLLEAKTADGQVTTLSPDQVRQVLSFDERDLTDEVGAACPADDIDFHLLGSRKHVPFRFALMADAGGGVALSNGNGGSKANGALVAGLRVGISDQLHARVGFRGQHASEATSAVGGTMAADTGELLVMMGIRLTRPRENNNYAYLEAGVSLVHYSDRFGADGRSLADADLVTISPALQGGVVLPLNRHVGVDIGGFVSSRGSLDAAAEQTVLSVGATVGVTLR